MKGVGEKTVLPLTSDIKRNEDCENRERSTPFKELKSLCEMAMGLRVLILA
jgi:hypothetical protein